IGKAKISPTSGEFFAHTDFLHTSIRVLRGALAMPTRGSSIPLLPAAPAARSDRRKLVREKRANRECRAEECRQRQNESGARGGLANGRFTRERPREIGCWERSARAASGLLARRRRRRRIWDPNPPRAAETACWADRQARVGPSSWANQIASPKVLHAALAPVAAGAFLSPSIEPLSNK